eukprot:1333216-Amorphochlora_amoeboformis.AAC.1
MTAREIRPIDGREREREETGHYDGKLGLGRAGKKRFAREENRDLREVRQSVRLFVRASVRRGCMPLFLRMCRSDM